MIQRIQSVFLFASLCLLVSMFFVPVAKPVTETGEMITFNLAGFDPAEAGATAGIGIRYSVMILGILVCALNLISIFMYRKRIQQMWLCLFNIFLLVGMSVVMLLVLRGVQDIRTFSPGLPAVFPVVSIILHYLAFRNIRKDELMVQSLNRLR